MCHQNKSIVVLDADLCKSTMTCKVEDELPAQYFEMGIGEQNMMSVAAGLSLTGKIPFVNSFAIFLTSRAFDQVRQAICNAALNVKIIGSSAGLSDFGDGSSHQTVEDMAIMRALPNMTVIAPCDGIETRKATHAIADYKGPVYMRTSRNDMPDLTTEDSSFEIGEVYPLKKGTDITVFACGIMVKMAMDASEKLAEEGISVAVVNVPTIKPLKRDKIIALSRETNAVVTAEEHNIFGGLGSAIAEALREEKIPIGFVGINDTFGVSCNEAEPLLVYYGLTVDAVISKIRTVLKLK
ncbi:MAG: transketolase [Bacteroidetes bacterium GWF2_42_66]|nr:MAG: transketolase [Bacteroidetes bacterium GWA2_42_15]OFX97130.1 MAG: transketolase [Bacteroidetes bacterium GWE2_42_39]OFY46201.1 MAG: transketolase [Bacteroidetes bacterium GWF2_42_66]